MKTKSLIVFLMCVSVRAQEPQFSKDNQLVRPANYREWVFLSAGLGMTYGPAAQGESPDSPRFDNVFVAPSAYKTFVQTGTWPEKTMFVLEIRSSQSKASINNGGRFQDEIVAVEASVKDSSRFPAKWAYFGFGKSGETAKPMEASMGCNACHLKNGAVDNTFVQFYPTLIPVAKAKGTLK